MTTHNLTAVQNFNGDAGATVWWTLTGWTSRDALRDAWVAQGLNPSDLPDLPTPEKRLGRAVGQVSELRRLARPVERRGHWAIVLESVEGEGGDALVTHSQSLTVRIVGGQPEWKHMGGDQSYALANAIYDEYYRREGYLHRDDISLWLSRVISGLHGTPLRPKGGLYYVLPAMVDQWRRVCAALEAAGAGSCYTLPTLRGEEATRAVLDALVRDVSDTASDYADKVHSGTLGGRALRARVKDCDNLLERISAYEGLLGGAVEQLRAKVVTVQDTALAAAFAAEAETMTDPAAE